MPAKPTQLKLAGLLVLILGFSWHSQPGLAEERFGLSLAPALSLSIELEGSTELDQKTTAAIQELKSLSLVDHSSYGAHYVLPSQFALRLDSFNIKSEVGEENLPWDLELLLLSVGYQFNFSRYFVNSTVGAALSTKFNFLSDKYTELSSNPPLQVFLAGGVTFFDSFDVFIASHLILVGEITDQDDNRVVKDLRFSAFSLGISRVL